MNATELIIALFLASGCYTTDIQETKLGKESYKVSVYRCLTHNFKTWQRLCPMGKGFYGRVFLIEERDTGESFYLNRFGEIMAGQYVDVTEVYLPPCGV